MRRLREKCKDGSINIELWYRYTVFDIICDLTVGESFKCLESDDLHPWITAMVDGGKPMGILTAINMYPALAAFLNPVLGIAAKGPMRLHDDMVKPMVEKRLTMGDRPDLINPLVRLQGSEVSPDKYCKFFGIADFNFLHAENLNVRSHYQYQRNCWRGR